MQIVKNHPNVIPDSNIRVPMNYKNVNVIAPAITTLKRSRYSNDTSLIINGKEYLDDVCSKFPASTKPVSRSNSSSCGATTDVKKIANMLRNESEISPKIDLTQREMETFIGDKENKANEMEKRESYDRWRRKVLEKH